VAVGDVMHKLPHGPAAVAIRGVDLGVVEAGNSGAQPLGELPKSVKLLGAGAGRCGIEPANGIAEVVKIRRGVCHGTNLSWRGETGAIQEGESGGGAGLGSRASRWPDASLRGTVVRMVVSHTKVMAVMTVAHAGKSRGRNHRQQQGSEDKLLHGLRLAPAELRWKYQNCGECAGVNQEGKQSGSNVLSASR
jgi:hypothetical protein